MKIDIIRLYNKYGYYRGDEIGTCNLFTYRAICETQEEYNTLINIPSSLYTTANGATDAFRTFLTYFNLNKIANNLNYSFNFGHGIEGEEYINKCVAWANSIGFFNVNPAIKVLASNITSILSTDSEGINIINNGRFSDSGSTNGAAIPRIYSHGSWSQSRYKNASIMIPIFIIYENTAGCRTLDARYGQSSLNEPTVDWRAITGDYSSNLLLNADVAPLGPSIDPYENAGQSKPAGGDGTFDFSSTDIPIPGLPSISAADTGFISLYHPSSSQLNRMAQYLWSGSFSLDNLKKLFANPMDVILGCQIIPTISGHPAVQTAELMVGNVPTGLEMPKCTEQYYEADMGTIQIQPKWGAYLDYSPYSKLQLYLPYIGIQEISPDDCMGGTIQVKYHIDILSGSCVAFVYCASNRGADGHTLYTFTGSCICPVPITEGQYGNAFVAGAQVLGGAAAAYFGGPTGAIKGTESIVKGVSSMVKPTVNRSGDIGGSAGLMDIQYPFLILTIPKMCIPGYQNVYVGYPSYITMIIGDLTGFTSIEVTHLNNMSCTQEEANEIISLLESGVIL